MRLSQSKVLRPRYVTWLLVGLGVGLAGWISVRAQTAAARLPQPTGEASVKGVVVDGLTGKAVPRVRVGILGAVSTNTTTDDLGAFEIPNLPRGAYSLLVDVPGRGINRYGERRADGSGTGLTLTEGQRLQGLRLLSWARATISGRVIAPGDRPVPGATVEFARRVFGFASYSAPRFRHDAVAETDASGGYRAELSAGHYLVTVRSTNVTIPAPVQEAYHQELATRSAGSLVTDRLALSAAPIITGRGLIVGDFRYQVMALRQPRAPAVPPSTAGITTTYLAHAREIELRSGLQSSLDFQLEVVPAFKVSGVVGGPKGGAWVAVRLTSMAEPEMMQFSTGPPVSGETAIAITDTHGAFTMLGVPAGRYELFVRVAADGPTVPPPQRSGIVESARAEVTVVDADVQGLALTLRPTPAVTGEIEFTGDVPPTSEQKGAMRFGLYEDLLSSTPKPLLPALRPDGSFRLVGLVPGRYWPMASLGQWGVRHLSINGQSLDDDVITLGDEGLSSVRVVATPWTSQAGVYGAVGLPPGTVPDDVTVAVFAADYAQRIAGARFSSRHVRFQRLGPAGFNLGFLLPGDYYLLAYREADGADPTREFFDRLASHARRVSLTDGEPRSVMLTVSDIAPLEAVADQ